MAYSHTLLTALDAQLASRLNDTGSVFFSSAERVRYLIESLRTWGACSTYWRERGVFNTAPGVPFYDITSASASMSALLGMTLTDLDLVTDIQYALMETVGVPWAGTEQFTLDDFTKAIQRRRDQFLAETGAVLTRSVIPAAPPPDGRVALSDAIIDVRRAAWVGADGIVAPLYRSDELQADYGMSGWSINPATPSLYSTIVSPPLTVQLMPVPLDVGQLDLLTVNAGATLDPTIPVLLGIPDDFAWVVKWGAIADLLGRDGIARDPDRAAYGEARWRQGVELARINPTAILAEIQGVDNLMDDLWNVDGAFSGWQTTPGEPTVVATAGRNMVALAQVPDRIYSVTLDVVRNAPVAAAFVQVGREILDVILDYAAHLAAFKMQGQEWKATARGMDNMLRQAALYNDKLRASALFKEILWPTAHRYQEKHPTRKQEAAIG